jgi:hypothetical protein
VCCNTHLAQMPPVSMRMAKLQKATLDPTKISGRCGRLKCCLRYEYETYEQLQRAAREEATAAPPAENGSQPPTVDKGSGLGVQGSGVDDAQPSDSES